MAESKQFCPQCGSPDLSIEHNVVKQEESKGSAECPLCGWAGDLKDTLGAISSENFFTTEKLASVLMIVISKHAAGPMCQVFEVFGILEPGDVEGRNKVMRAAFEGCITKAFEAAAEHYGSKHESGQQQSD